MSEKETIKGKAEKKAIFAVVYANVVLGATDFGTAHNSRRHLERDLHGKIVKHSISNHQGKNKEERNLPSQAIETVCDNNFLITWVYQMRLSIFITI